MLFVLFSFILIYSILFSEKCHAKKFKSIETINIFNSNFNNYLNNCKTIFVPISQGQQRLYAEYHNLLDTDDVEFNYNKCKWKYDFKLSYFYQQSINSNEIAKSLFKNPTLNFIGGAQKNLDNRILLDNGRPANALIPEYFGLSDNTKTSLCLLPVIRNSIIELQFSISLKNIWMQVVAPITFSNWQINNGILPNQYFDNNDTEILDGENANFKLYNINNTTPYAKSAGTTPVSYNGINEINETLNFDLEIENEFTADNPEVYIGFWNTPIYTNKKGSEDAIEINLSNSISQDNQFAGKDDTLSEIKQEQIDPAKSLTEALGGYLFGDVKSRQYNLFNFGNNDFNSKIGISDLQLWLGWDPIHKDYYDIGFYIRGAIPCGTKLNSDWLKYVFSPIIGNGGHIGLGAGVTSNLYFFFCEHEDFTLHLDGYLMHLFGSDQFRSFDQINNPMSRYSILKKLKYDEQINPGGYSDSFSLEGLFPLGDINSGLINVYIPLSGEFVADLIYRYKCCSGGIGYAISGQTSEKSQCIKDSCSNVIFNIMPNSLIKLKNNQYYYGYKSIACLSSFVISAENIIFTSPTTPFSPTQASFYAKTNENITIGGDSGVYKYGELTGFPDNDGIVDIVTKDDVFILPDFNRSGLMESQILNKIFGHIEIFWPDNLFCPSIKAMIAYNFSSNSSFTANSIEIGFQFYCNF